MKHLELKAYLKLRSLKESLKKGIKNKREGLSAVEIVIAVAVTLGLAFLIFTFFQDKLKNEILPDIAKKIKELFQ